MKQKQKIIVDTSVWIEYFKNDPAIAKIIDEGLYANKIYFVGVVIAELLQGVKSNKELTVLSNYIDSVPYLDCKMKDWADTSRISWSLRKSGITLPLTDLIIYSVARNNDAVVFTKDKHFSLIPDIKLYKN